MLLGGALFGACFPAIATTVDCLLTFGQISLAHLVRTQIEQPLRWMIDTVPIFLSLFAGFTGHHFDQLRKFDCLLRCLIWENQRRKEIEIKLKKINESLVNTNVRSVERMEKLQEAREVNLCQNLIY